MPIKRRFVTSRSAFFRVLDEALAETRRIAGPSPTWPAIEQILLNLDAMKRFTANGRDPTKSERRDASIGPIVVREIAPGAPADLEDYVQKLHELNGYFREWLTDDQVASGSDGDLMSDFDDLDD